MFAWHKLPPDQKINFLSEAAARTGYPAQFIEKDFWVTVALKAVFETPWAGSLVCKGGTSLSKGWGLIDRFCENIDLAIDRRALGFSKGDVSRTQVKKLREKSAQFIEATFLPALDRQLLTLGIKPSFFQLEIEPISTGDVDPRMIVLRYKPLVEATGGYVEGKVKIEIGARSLREPCARRPMQSILSALFPGSPVQDPVFDGKVVLPERTFLEKAMLLHEEHLKMPAQRRHRRLSRHLYDLYRIKKSGHAVSALADKALFDTIVVHRIFFNAIRGINYAHHTLLTINFIPPAEVLDRWRLDYEQMANMVYGDSPSFDQLLEEMHALLQMFRDAGKVVTPVQIAGRFDPKKQSSLNLK